MKNKIIAAVCVFVVCMCISFYCGKRSEHYSNKQIDTKWNSIPEDTRYKILDHVLKLREL